MPLLKEVKGDTSRTRQQMLKEEEEKETRVLGKEEEEKENRVERKKEQANYSWRRSVAVAPRK